jgi:hypothetical protein
MTDANNQSSAITADISYLQAVQAAQTSNLKILQRFLETALAPVDKDRATDIVGPQDAESYQHYHGEWCHFLKMSLIYEAVMVRQTQPIGVIVPDYQAKKALSEQDQDLCDYAFKVASGNNNVYVVEKMLSHGHDPSADTLKWSFYNAIGFGSKDLHNLLVGVSSEREWADQQKFNIAKARALNLIAIQAQPLDTLSVAMVNYFSEVKDSQEVVTIGRQAIYSGKTMLMPWLAQNLNPKEHHILYFDAIHLNKPDAAVTMYQEISARRGYIEEHPFPVLMLPLQVKSQVLEEGLWRAINQESKVCLSALIDVAKPAQVTNALKMAIKIQKSRSVAAIIDRVEARIYSDNFSQEEKQPWRKVRSDSFLDAIEQGDYACATIYLEKKPLISAKHLKSAAKHEDSRIFDGMLALANQQTVDQISPYVVTDEKIIMATDESRQRTYQVRQQNLANIAPFLAAGGYWGAAEKAYDALPKQANGADYGAMLADAASANQYALCVKLLESHADISQGSRIKALQNACLKGHREAVDAVLPSIDNPDRLVDLALVMAESGLKPAEPSVMWLIERADCHHVSRLKQFGLAANLSWKVPVYLNTVLTRLAKTDSKILDVLYANMLSQDKIIHLGDFVAEYVGAGASPLIGQFFDLAKKGDTIAATRVLNRIPKNPDINAAAAYFCASDEKRADLLSAIFEKRLPRPVLYGLAQTAELLENASAIRVLQQYGIATTIPATQPANQNGAILPTLPKRSSV